MTETDPVEIMIDLIEGTLRSIKMKIEMELNKYTMRWVFKEFIEEDVDRQINELIEKLRG